MPAVNVNDLILKIPVSERAAFKKRVEQIADGIGATYGQLMAIMDLESAHTFDPSITNSLGYTGLIQFGKKAANDLGTTTEALRNMTRLEQLDYVEAYFKMVMKRYKITKVNGFVDLYLMVFWPEGIKETDLNRPFTNDSVEAANRKLRNAAGDITKNSILAAYEKDYEGLYEKSIRLARTYWWQIGLIGLGMGLVFYVTAVSLERNKLAITTS